MRCGAVGCDARGLRSGRNRRPQLVSESTNVIPWGLDLLCPGWPGTRLDLTGREDGMIICRTSTAWIPSFLRRECLRGANVAGEGGRDPCCSDLGPFVDAGLGRRGSWFRRRG
ncbi:hypothetical protein CGRA01v4_11929 [Colletotrichum graminicola]|nr:hypothetical protein CGRA01v4_11929 [Colletotrichum graminicola]